MSVIQEAKTALLNASAKGFFHLLSANLAISLLSFGAQLLVIKFLSPAEMADIKTMQSFIGIAVVIASVGLNTAVLKLCSEQRSDAERALILRKSLRYTVIPNALVLAAIAAAALLGLFSPSSRVNDWMMVLMFSVPATALGSVLMMYLQARKRIKLMATAQTMIRVVGLTVIVLAAFFYGFGGFVIASAIVAIAALAPLVSLVKDDLVGSKSDAEESFPLIWYYARWSLAGNLVATTIGFLDILMLNYLIDDRVGLGYYSIATIFVLGLSQVTSTVQTIATPFFSEYSSDRSQFMRVLKKYQKMLMLTALALTVASMVIVPWLIVLFYGESYAPAGEYFQILAVKYFLWSCYALLGIAIWGVGKMKLSFYNALATLVVSTVISYVLIIRNGLQGAAIAQVVSYLFSLIIVAFVAKVALESHFHSLTVTSGDTKRKRPE